VRANRPTPKPQVAVSGSNGKATGHFIFKKTASSSRRKGFVFSGNMAADTRTGAQRLCDRIADHGDAAVWWYRTSGLLGWRGQCGPPCCVVKPRREELFWITKMRSGFRRGAAQTGRWTRRPWRSTFLKSGLSIDLPAISFTHRFFSQPHANRRGIDRKLSILEKAQHGPRKPFCTVTVRQHRD